MSSSDPIDVDWSDPSLEPGEREATVKAVVSVSDSGQPLRSKNAGDRMVKVVLKLDGGGEIHDYIMLEGAGAPMGTRKLKALGMQKGEKLIPDELVGRRVKVECVVQDYNGESSLKAKKYIALAEYMPPIAPGDDTPF